MPKLLIGLGLALVILTVYTLVDCAVFDRKHIRGLPRWVWIFVIVLVPLIGPLLWLLVGHGRATPTTRSSRSVAPDDDLDFLRGLNGGNVATVIGENRPFNEKDQQERIRRMEQDLADLDKNDPTPNKSGANGAADTAGVDPKKKKIEPGEGDQPGRRDA
ncbi:PLD nuclease N-terminal domain-containing protein [Cryobacterium ruanii]|uniref:Cardiolipin synthase N-terminal domain-containing protein n=1 Tax=Cryobacterium ruanii TaxID=1259197 RepID=A0A4R9AMW5_9MICO|nr:PLD nuclease N-terminal domain-containing protein [Cryobacterium ruanii]TFD66358.1 hypothetical protein E3T47_07605 [Cryobacterium ruanii]